MILSGWRKRKYICLIELPYLKKDDRQLKIENQEKKPKNSKLAKLGKKSEGYGNKKLCGNYL